MSAPDVAIVVTVGQNLTYVHVPTGIDAHPSSLAMIDPWIDDLLERTRAYYNERFPGGSVRVQWVNTEPVPA